MGNFALPWAGCSREGPHVVPWLSAGAGDPPAAPTPRPQPGLRSLSFEQPAPGDKLPAPATGSFPLFIPHLWLFLPREDPGIAVLFGAVCRTPRANSPDGSTEVLPVGLLDPGSQAEILPLQQRGAPGQGGEGRKEAGNKKEGAGSERPAPRAAGKEPRVPQSLLAPQLFVHGAKPERVARERGCQ